MFCFVVVVGGVVVVVVVLAYCLLRQEHTRVKRINKLTAK